MVIKIFETHDNGGRPFLVKINSNPNRIVVYTTHPVSKKVLDISYLDVFIGDNKLKTPNNYDPEYKYVGNSILVRTFENQYIFIGHKIYSFKARMGDTIKQLQSGVGNSDVPYPYAIGDEYTYFLLDQQTLPNHVLNLKYDAYRQFYHTLYDKKNFRVKTICIPTYD
jgi:hypothetical protein